MRRRHPSAEPRAQGRPRKGGGARRQNWASCGKLLPYLWGGRMSNSHGRCCQHRNRRWQRPPRAPLREDRQQLTARCLVVMGGVKALAHAISLRHQRTEWAECTSVGIRVRNRWCIRPVGSAIGSQERPSLVASNHEDGWSAVSDYGCGVAIVLKRLAPVTAVATQPCKCASPQGCKWRPASNSQYFTLECDARTSHCEITSIVLYGRACSRL